MPPSRPVLLMDRAGAAYAAWNGAESGAPGLFSTRRQAGKPWETERIIANAPGPWSLWSPALSIDDRGTLHAIWSDSRDQKTSIYAAAQTADGHWSQSAPVSDLGTGARVNPTIAVDGQGNAFAAWQSFHGCEDNGRTGDIEFARQPAGGGWERSVLVTTDIGSSNVSNPVIAATSDGAIYLVWEEQIRGRYTLFASHRSASGAWQPKTPVPDSFGNRASTQPAVALDAQGNVYVTWWDSRNTQSVIRLAQTTESEYRP